MNLISWKIYSVPVPGLPEKFAGGKITGTNDVADFLGKIIWTERAQKSLEAGTKTPFCMLKHKRLFLMAFFSLQLTP